MKRDILNVSMVVLVLFAVGFSVFSLFSLKLSGTQDFPLAAQENEQVKTAYLFAQEQQTLLERLPCFCGCVNMGHRHNRDCYIDDDGNWVEHGSLCGGCVGVTLDAKKLFLEGKSVKEIRAFVDEKYGSAEMADPTLTPPVI